MDMFENKKSKEKYFQGQSVVEGVASPKSHTVK